MELLKLKIEIQRSTFNLNVNTTIKDGITGIYGPSGAGKTTLLQAVSGAVTPTKGFIQLNNHILFDKNKNIHVEMEHRRIGVVYQEGRLFPHLTVEKNLTFAYPTKNISKKIDFEAVVNLLQLNSLLAAKPSKLSGGQAQRVAIGRALLSQPDLLLLDEPFSNLDKKIRNEIIAFLIRVKEIFGIPMLVVSHEMGDILKLTRSLIIIDNGRVKGEGNYYSLVGNEKLTPYLEFSELINVMDLHVKQKDNNSELIQFVHPFSHNLKINFSGNGSLSSLKDGDRVIIGLSANDIVIALHPVQEISVQNQVKATLIKMVNLNNTVYCILDCGVQLIAEITNTAGNNLNLKKGDNVYCLFKSRALRIISAIQKPQ